MAGDDATAPVTRRTAIAGMVSAFGLSVDGVDTASAQASSEPRIQMGDSVELDENANGEPVLRHTPSGAELVYDSNSGRWTVGDFEATTVTTEDLYNTDRAPHVVVKERNGTIYAVDSDGVVDSGTDATTVLQAAFDSLTTGRTWIETVKVKGDFTLSDTVTVPDYAHADLYGARFTLSDSFPGGSAAMDSVNQAEVAAIEGGLFDGNRSNLSGQNNDGLLLVGDGTDGTDYHHPRSVVRDCHFKNFTRVGFQSTVRRPTAVNISAFNCGNRAIDINGGDGLYLNLGVDDCDGNGIAIRSGFNLLINPMVEGCGSAGIVVESTGRDSKVWGGFTEFNSNEGINVRGSQRVLFRDMLVWGNEDGGIRFAGGSIENGASRYNHATGCRLGGSGQAEDIIFEGGADVLPRHNFAYKNIYEDNTPSIVRNGERNVVNGRSTNAGDPSSTGDWNGNASLADQYNLVIEDTSNNDLYMVVNGAWAAIATTA